MAPGSVLYWPLLLLAAKSCAATAESAACSSPSLCGGFRTGEMRYALTGRRNSSGHWTSRLQFDHEVSNDESPWWVVVDQSTSHFRNKEYIHVEATIIVPPARKPRADYVLVHGHGYYKYHTQGTPWEEARRMCEFENAHLAIVNSEAEAKSISPLMKNGQWTFIGNVDVQRKGTFMTIYNETLPEAGYNKWYPGEPDYPGTQNCGLLNVNSLLGNSNCDGKFPFMCEFEY